MPQTQVPVPARGAPALCRATEAYLHARHVPQARLLSEWLVSGIAGCSRLELYGRGDEPLSGEQRARIARGRARLGAGEPLQYVEGHAEFMGHRFRTDRRAFIPRPETEGLVERVLACTSLRAVRQPLIVDVGTGSGCVAVALALARPAARLLAIDLKAPALELARENAALHKVNGRTAFLLGDLLEALRPGSATAVVSNPPYIAREELPRLPLTVRRYEPHEALDGGPDGLSAIRRLVPQAAQALRRGGPLFMEIGENQADAVKALMHEAGFARLDVTRDLAGKDRVVCGYRT
ncbi:MAG: peptide chain release factor N(5)-glutamine methyltransferase [Kiritimatiellae bacterium]|nr:peptide chain release factor N(5)-glutamine methyltransferase [Kiritimatiellia bacterium]